MDVSKSNVGAMLVLGGGGGVGESMERETE